MVSWTRTSRSTTPTSRRCGPPFSLLLFLWWLGFLMLLCLVLVLFPLLLVCSFVLQVFHVGDELLAMEGMMRLLVVAVSLHQGVYLEALVDGTLCECAGLNAPGVRCFPSLPLTAISSQLMCGLPFLVASPGAPLCH